MECPWATRVHDIIESRKEKLSALSRYIWENPELALQEFKAHDYLTDFLENEGFRVERHWLLDTAFRAEYGTVEGDKVPTIAMLCEYDALPEIGHACGHNLIAESAVAAGIAVKEVLQNSPSIRGKVVILGTPAEEGACGKALLVQKDGFRGVDVALMAHPGYGNLLKIGVTATQQVTVHFRGHAAHAAGAPWEGVNALDAAVASYMNVSVLRQQMKPTWRVQGVFLNAGKYPNVIPEESVLKYVVRAPNKDELDVLFAKVEACFRGAAEATGCSVTIEKGVSYHNILHNDTLLRLYKKHGESVGLVFDGVDPMQEVPVGGSTDAGNVSYVVPTIHPLYLIPTKAQNHTREFCEAAGNASAEDLALRVAKALALTALDIIREPDLLQRVHEEFSDYQATSKAVKH